MASIPEVEEKCAYGVKVEPGWIYYKSTYQPGPDTHQVKVEKCPPRFTFDIIKQTFIKNLLASSSSGVFDKCLWVKDFNRENNEGTVLLTGVKIVDVTGVNVEPSSEKYVVKSVHYKYNVDMLIHLSTPLDDKVEDDLKKDLNKGTTEDIFYILPKQIIASWKKAFIYPDGLGRTEVCTPVYGFREFFRMLKNSEVSYYPSTTTVMKPLTPSLSSYAAIIKDDCAQSSRECGVQLAISPPLTPSTSSYAAIVKGTVKSPQSTREYGVQLAISHRQDESEAETHTMSDDIIKSKSYEGIVSTGRRDEGVSECGEPGNKYSRHEFKGSSAYSGRERTLVDITLCHSSSESSRTQISSNSSKRFKESDLTQAYNSPGRSTALILDRPEQNVSVTTTAVDITISHNGSESSRVQGSSYMSKIIKESDLPQTHKSPGNHLPEGQNKGSLNILYSGGSVGKLCSGNKVTKTSYHGTDKSGIITPDTLVPHVEVTTASDLVYTRQDTRKENATLHDEPRAMAGSSGILPISDGFKDKGSKPSSDGFKDKGSKPYYQHTGTTVKEDNPHTHQTDSVGDKIIDLSSTLIQPFEEGELCGMTRKYYGIKSEKKEKVIILLGASGSGKTTLVNFIANYFRGTKKADGELVRVARSCNDAQSFTRTITAYTFCPHQDHAPITIIDTPGLNDSSGAEVRDHVLSLKTFLANIASHHLEIHAIGFVAQAHLVRLTSSERLVMDYISTLFGEGSGEHIITFVTFSDNQENPPVIEAMMNYGVKCKMFLKFNNSVLTIKTTDEVDELDRAYWRIGFKSWKKCMKALEELPPLSGHTMKSLQQDVYTSQVVELVERDLRSELKAFITYTKQSRLMSPAAITACKSVWELATAASHLKYGQSSNTHLVKTLVQYTEEVCGDIGAKETMCVKLLSLHPSRELVRAGVGILQSMAPIYNIILEQCNRVTNSVTDIKITLYCFICNSDHQLQRDKKAKKVTYRCIECWCDGAVHGEQEDVGVASMGREATGLNPHKLLQHTRNYVSEAVQQLSIPGYLLQERQYLAHLDYFTESKYKEFIKALDQL